MNILGWLRSQTVQPEQEEPMMLAAGPTPTTNLQLKYGTETWDKAGTAAATKPLALQSVVTPLQPFTNTNQPRIPDAPVLNKKNLDSFFVK